MTAMTPVPADHPLMKAWEAHKATKEYANSKRWAVNHEHVEGSLWALFSAGWSASELRTHPTAQPVAWGILFDERLMPTTYATEHDALKEFRRRNTVYPNDADCRRLTPLYAAPQPEGPAGEPQRLPYDSPMALWKAFKGGAKFVLHYHGQTFNVTHMEPREKVLYVQPPGMPVKVFPDGRSAEGNSPTIWLASPPPSPKTGEGSAIEGGDSTHGGEQ